MTPIVIFDIETVPDVISGKRMHQSLNELNDKDAMQAMIAMRQAEIGSDFMQLPLHKIACLSMLWIDEEQMKLKSFSLNERNESEILSTFFGIFQRSTLPNLVSWNGGGFDIPVMLYRAMHHKLTAPSFFKETGEMKYNNYLNRYHSRHLDLMDKVSLYGYNRQSLDTVSGVCGFAGKQDIDGSMVVDLVQNNEWDTLTTYCESDVLNTWLIYLRWQLLTGDVSHEKFNHFESVTRDYLQNLYQSTETEDSTHLRHANFLKNWKE